jgi:hypothetical protein
MSRHYRYVGSRDLLKLLEKLSRRACIQDQHDILYWIRATQQQVDRDKTLAVTFIIELEHRLWINDRRSEHVVCAAGQPVLSAGEMTFLLDARGIEVVEVTNQSTGYCPEPESWPDVAQALNTIGLSHPGDFTTAFLFRRCDSCGMTNLIKDDWFECGVCGTSLNAQWNFDSGEFSN